MDVELNNLDFSVSRSDHWFLNTVLKSWVRGYIHDALIRTLEHQIRTALEDADLKVIVSHFHNLINIE